MVKGKQKMDPVFSHQPLRQATCYRGVLKKRVKLFRAAGKHFRSFPGGSVAKLSFSLLQGVGFFFNIEIRPHNQSFVWDARKARAPQFNR